MDGIKPNIGSYRADVPPLYEGFFTRDDNKDHQRANLLLLLSSVSVSGSHLRFAWCCVVCGHAPSGWAGQAFPPIWLLVRSPRSIKYAIVGMTFSTRSKRILHVHRFALWLTIGEPEYQGFPRLQSKDIEPFPMNLWMYFSARATNAVWVRYSVNVRRRKLFSPIFYWQRR